MAETWILQPGGTAVRTYKDGGKTISIGVIANLYCVDFYDSDNGVVVGEDGIILRTTNKGADFRKE